MQLRLIIYGPPRTKKNSQKIFKNKRTGKPFVTPSEPYKIYEAVCMAQIKKPARPISDAVNVCCVYYMPARRKVDLVNLIEATCDILVCARVLEDDNRDIVAATDGSRVIYDKANPRVEITIISMEDYEQWRNFDGKYTKR